MTSFNAISEIHCDFETDFCNWEVYNTGPFAWHLVTGDYIEGAAESGPHVDHQGDPKGQFVIAQVNLAEYEGEETELGSPILKGNEHAIECFHFWFAMEVGAIKIEMVL